MTSHSDSIIQSTTTSTAATINDASALVPRSKLQKPSKQRRWLKLELIGSGSFADCFKIQHVDTGSFYVTKTIDLVNQKSNVSRQVLLSTITNEIAIHKSLRHPNIVRYRARTQTPNLVNIVLEFCNEGTLRERIMKKVGRGQSGLSSSEIWMHLYDLLQALQYIHAHHVIHRDIKSSNVLLSMVKDENGGYRCMSKVSDFGLAVYHPHDRPLAGKIVCGTPTHMAPEIIDHKTYSPKSDMWALGCVLYNMMYGKTPFGDKNKELIYDNIRNYRLHLPNQQAQDPDLVNLVHALLDQNPDKRPSAQELLAHPVFLMQRQRESSFQTK